MTADMNDRELDLLLVAARMVPPAADSTLAVGRAVLDAALDATRDELATRRRRRIRFAVVAGVV